MFKIIRTLPLAIMLAGCSTTSMETKEAAVIFPSARSQEAVADCLLNRLASDVRHGKLDRRDGETIVSFDGIFGVMLVFTIRDAPGGGTITEMRRFMRTTPGRANASTCF